MLQCRSLLSQVCYTTPAPIIPFFTYRSASAAVKRHAPVYAFSSQRPTSRSRNTRTQLQPPSSLALDVSPHSHPRVTPKAEARTMDTRSEVEGDVETPREHEELDYSANGYYGRYAAVVDRGNDTLLNRLVERVFRKFSGSDQERKEFLTWALFKTDFRRFRGQSVLSMLEAIGGIQALSLQQFKYLVIQICTRLYPSAVDQVLIDTIFPRILSDLERIGVVPGGPYAITHIPPQVVYLSFAVLSKLLAVGDQAKALQIFRLLFEKSYIPPEAIQATPTSSQNFKLIMSLTTARACMHWEYRIFAHQLLTGIIPSHSDNADSLLPEVLSLCTDFLYSTLPSPRRPDFSSCVDLIIKLHPTSPVEDGIIRTAYTSAAQHDFPFDATRLYTFTRHRDIVIKHRYPAPQGDTLLWLSKYMTAERGLAHLTRKLAAEVADQAIFLPLQSRAEFITTVADQGFATSARMLWKRYSTGKDRHIVVGSAALMLRMVSLFNRLIGQLEKTLVRGEEHNPDEEFLVFRNHDNQSLEKRVTDLVRFVNEVLSEFVRIHEPLEDAKHENLTALARAYFILGDVSKGFDVFKILLDRRETPDLYDINTALTSLAAHHPRSAARIVERMVERGLKPDSVSLGTIIHHGLLLKDFELVRDLVTQGSESWGVDFDAKTISILLRASVGTDVDDSGSPVRSRLEAAFDIITSLRGPNVGIVTSPRMGKYMVYESLRAKEFEMAFKFWKLLLRRAAEWEDREQIFIRRQIARGVGELKGIGSNAMKRMLQQLRQPPKETQPLVQLRNPATQNKVHRSTSYVK